jgi:hypothetical protein
LGGDTAGSATPLNPNMTISKASGCIRNMIELS